MYHALVLPSTCQIYKKHVFTNAISLFTTHNKGFSLKPLHFPSPAAHAHLLFIPLKLQLADVIKQKNPISLGMGRM